MVATRNAPDQHHSCVESPSRHPVPPTGRPSAFDPPFDIRPTPAGRIRRHSTRFDRATNVPRSTTDSQILTIEELFDGKRALIPDMALGSLTFKKAKRQKTKDGDTPLLLEHEE